MPSAHNFCHCREGIFLTLDGPVLLADTQRQAPKMRILGSTLLALLCM